MIRYMNELGKGEEVEHEDYYWEFVDRLFKPGTDEEQLTHAAMGVSTEAGEILDCVKKHVFYGKPLDRENLIEELGDINFYLEKLYLMLSISRESVLRQNMEKLGKRYPKGYSDKAAQERADKC